MLRWGDGAKLRQLDKLQHQQPDVVHDARQRRVPWRRDARHAPRAFVERPPVQPHPRSNRQQVLDPRLLPFREPGGVSVNDHAPIVSVELDLERVLGDGGRQGGQGGARGVRFLQGRHDLVGRRNEVEVWAVGEDAPSVGIYRDGERGSEWGDQGG